jgi:cation diffusion facilitator CzcD-associated flavoprotein CzcO
MHDGLLEDTTRDPAIAIVGAGMSGLCVVIALPRSEINDVTFYDDRGLRVRAECDAGSGAYGP